MSEIWAGPFLGEFGWETTIWSPWLRHEQHRLKVPFHVVCEDGKDLLYRDFAMVHEVRRMESVRRDCQNAFRPKGGKLTREDYENYCITAAGHGVKCLTPIDLTTVWPGGVPQARQAAFKTHYKKTHGERNWVAIHARRAQHEDRNWPPEAWHLLIDKLTTRGHEVLSIGAHRQTHDLEGVTDYRGCDLWMLAEYLSSCRYLVGPSSGPMAFAMLCEVPVIWWSKNRKDVGRFAGSWNPFHTLEHRVRESWSPTVEEVANSCPLAS